MSFPFKFKEFLQLSVLWYISCCSLQRRISIFNHKFLSWLAVSQFLIGRRFFFFNLLKISRLLLLVLLCFFSWFLLVSFSQVLLLFLLPGLIYEGLNTVKVSSFPRCFSLTPSRLLPNSSFWFCSFLDLFRFFLFLCDRFFYFHACISNRFYDFLWFFFIFWCYCRFFNRWRFSFCVLFLLLVCFLRSFIRGWLCRVKLKRFPSILFVALFFLMDDLAEFLFLRILSILYQRLFNFFSLIRYYWSILLQSWRLNFLNYWSWYCLSTFWGYGSILR